MIRICIIHMIYMFLQEDLVSSFPGSDMGGSSVQWRAGVYSSCSVQEVEAAG